MRGKTIRHFLIDGQVDGRWSSELSNWTGKAYKIPRTYINQCSDRKDLGKTGVYFLIGRNDETDVELIIVNPDEEYEEIKKIITPSVKSKLSGKINLFSIE